MPEVPAWLKQLADQVASHIFAVDILAPLGCHYYHNLARDQWEVTLFVSRSETIGGPRDGQETSSRFTMDLCGLQQEFHSLENFFWQPLPLGEDDQLGAHLSVEGTVEGRNIWLRVLSQPPREFEAGRYVVAAEHRLEDRW